jgi:hypothetical protein
VRLAHRRVRIVSPVRCAQGTVLTAHAGSSACATTVTAKQSAINATRIILCCMFIKGLDDFLNCMTRTIAKISDYPMDKYLHERLS